MIEDKVKQRIKFCTAIVIIACVIAVAIFMVVRYDVEGEKKVPFSLGKIIVISSATTTNESDVDSSGVEGENSENGKNNQNQPQENVEDNNNQENTNSDGTDEQEESEQANEEPAEVENYIWNENIVQTNDVYIYLDKNADFGKEEIIKSVRIENLKVLDNVKVGKIQAYMPNSLDDGLYKYTKEFVINSSLTYTGAMADNKKNLEIGNQGGCICISFANVGLDRYKSNENQELEQGGSILQKMNVADEDLKFQVSFDLIIEVKDLSYKTNVVLDLPAEDLAGQRETHKEITDFSELVYKRL